MRETEEKLGWCGVVNQEFFLGFANFEMPSKAVKQY